MSERLLDIDGIDAILDHFRNRRTSQTRYAQTTSEWEADHPRLLRPSAIRSMELRYKMIAERLATDVAAVLRTGISVELASMDQVRLSTLLDGMPSRCCVFTIDLPNVPVPAWLMADTQTTTSMIDLLVGGSGNPSWLDRDLTAIEQRVVRDVVRPVVASHAAVLSTIRPVEMSWDGFNGTPEQLRPLPGTEIYMRTRYSIRVEDRLDWTFEFALPLRDFMNDIERASTVPIETLESESERRSTMERNLSDIQVTTSVELGSAEIPLEDIMALATGDVVLLDRREGELFGFSVEGIEKYKGTLGRNGKSLAFKVHEAASVLAAGSKDPTVS